MRFNIVCFVLIGCICVLNAVSNDSNKIDNKDKLESKSSQNKVEIQGDTLVITNSLCNSKSHKSLLSSLNAKDSKNISSKQECEDNH